MESRPRRTQKDTKRSAAIARLHITRNEIFNTGGTGEGMYLGGNNASVIMRESVIALNHVHDTDQAVGQGDGIEVKQGSWGNLIADNLVHDCNYPCILVYGTVTAGIDGAGPGRGLADFVDVSWDGTRREAQPTLDSALLAAAEIGYATARDITGRLRTVPHTAGCHAGPP